MKKLFLLFPLLLCSACIWQQPVSNTDIPDATGGPIPKRVGLATAATWFWFWNTGDASVERAQQNGGITEVSSVTKSSKNYFGLYKRHTTTVRGN